jgi:hypothetical protein
MKILSIVLLLAGLMVVPAGAAARDEKPEKGKKATKPVPPQMWTVVIEGGTGDVAAAEVKTILSGLRGVNVEECAFRDSLVEAVISSGSRVNRTDISKALRENNKALKIKEFKTKRPERESDSKETPAKPGDAREAPAKPADSKESPAKPASGKETPAKPAPGKETPAKPAAPEVKKAS